MQQQARDMIELYTRPRPTAATFWLHGLGAGGTDMDAIVTNLKRSRELGLHHLAPDAPVRPVTVNDGRATRAWFDVLGEPGAVPDDRAGMDESVAWIHGLLEQEHTRHGIPAARTIVGGFSQGAALALHAGLRYRQALAGVVVLSGELPLAELLAEERHPANADTPILIIHGVDDPAIPLADARRGRDRLQDLGYAVDWYEFPMGHAVTLDVIGCVDDWLHRRLAPETPDA